MIIRINSNVACPRIMKIPARYPFFCFRDLYIVNVNNGPGVNAPVKATRKEKRNILSIIY